MTLTDNLNFHFGIKIQQAPPPNQYVLSVVFRKAEGKGNNFRRQKMTENVSQI